MGSIMTNIPVSDPRPCIPTSHKETLEESANRRRKPLYDYLAQICPAEEIQKDVIPPKVEIPYFPEDRLFDLVEDSVRGLSKRQRLHGKIAARAENLTFKGYVSRESFVRILEDENCFNEVLNYCKRNLEG